MRTRGKSAAFVFILFYVSYSSIYLARINFSVAAALLQDEGVINTALTGVIGSVFFFTYAVSKLINGYIGDKVSPKIMIVIGLLLTGLSNVIISLAPVYPIIAIFWGVNAFGQAMIWGPMLRQLSFCYDNKKIKTATALLISSVSVGSIAGLLVAGLCASLYDVAICFLIPGIIALFMCIAVLFLLPYLNMTIAAKTCKQEKKPYLKKEFLLMVTPAIVQGMIKENIIIWMAVYFVDVFGINVKSVSGFIFFIPLMGLIGRFLYPLLYRLFRKNENHVSIFAFSICVLAVMPLFMGVADSMAAVVCLGLISAMVSIINTHMLSAFPLRFASSGNISFIASTMDVLVYGGAGIGSLLFGMIIQKFGYSSMFAVWAFASVVSICFMILSLNARKTTA